MVGWSQSTRNRAGKCVQKFAATSITTSRCFELCVETTSFRAASFQLIENETGQQNVLVLRFYLFKIFLKPDELHDYSNVYYSGINDSIKLSADFEQDGKAQVKKGIVKFVIVFKVSLCG